MKACYRPRVPPDVVRRMWGRGVPRRTRCIRCRHREASPAPCPDTPSPPGPSCGRQYIQMTAEQSHSAAPVAPRTQPFPTASTETFVDRKTV
eukprot:793488-Prorocentrum_minimum.AAC.2